MTTAIAPDTKYKFIVSSAEEAVKVLREKLGENARVISVRQVEGAGLAKFLRAPKLEVIAQVCAPESFGEPQREPDPEPAAAAETTAPPAPPAQAPDSRSDSDERCGSISDKVSRILQRGGITDSILARIRTHETWPKIARMPLRQALTEVAVLLRYEHQHIPRHPVADSVAFIGMAGGGKTTALCKRLAMDVFFKQRRAVVLKVDLEKANPSDGLSVFCEVLGVALVRSIKDIPFLGEDETLYIDFPGVTPGNAGEIEATSRLLESTGAASRVLVVNAAYEIDLIKQAYGMGGALGATHIVFTHLDELTHWGKLWEFVLSPELTPLFLGSGQNIAGDFSESVFDSVLERTFPVAGKEAANTQREL